RDELADAPNAYRAALDAKERYLTTTDDPRGVRLMELADERGRLEAESREVTEALHAAEYAARALSRERDWLCRASSWPAYDTFFGGGALSSQINPDRLDEAAQLAAQADQSLVRLRTELADVHGIGLTAPQLRMDNTTRFFDIWFDNIFTDLAVR